MKNFLYVSVIIPTYNRGKPFRETLESVFVQNYPQYEIIVVDQSDKKFPKKEKFLAQHKTKIRYFSGFKPNAAAARNLGVKKARGDILLFLDDDVICQKNLLANHVKNYGESLIGAVAGRVITPDQPIKKDSRRIGQITPWGSFISGFSSKISQKVMTVISCNASWRRDAFEKIGGFDENFTGPIREDSDLSLRTVKARYEIVFEPQAVVIHQRAESGGFRKTEGRLKWYLGFFKSETYFFLKHINWYWWPVFWLTRWQWFFRCMFGFGREVSLKSLKTPWLGIYHGWQIYRRWKSENRG